MLFPIFLALFSLINVSYTSANGPNGLEFDFCVANPTLPYGPPGYACKDPSKVTTDDFTYSGLRNPGSSVGSPFKLGTNFATVKEFPALNGMGISGLRLDVDVGGAVPLHTHRVAELILVAQGTIGAGFIDTNNTVYYKVLQRGDLMIIPPTLVHFQINLAQTTSIVVAAFASPNPGVQVISSALFGNNLPTEIIQRVTLFDADEIKKLKAQLGGTG